MKKAIELLEKAQRQMKSNFEWDSQISGIYTIVTDALALLKEQPEGKFTKKWRGNIGFWKLDKLDNQICRMAGIALVEACDIIDRQAAELKKLKDKQE